MTREARLQVATDATSADSDGKDNGPDWSPVRAIAILAWSWRQELNLQPTAYKAVALPLSYASERAQVYANA